MAVVALAKQQAKASTRMTRRKSLYPTDTVRSDEDVEDVLESYQISTRNGATIKIQQESMSLADVQPAKKIRRSSPIVEPKAAERDSQKAEVPDSNNSPSFSQPSVLTRELRVQLKRTKLMTSPQTEKPHTQSVLPQKTAPDTLEEKKQILTAKPKVSPPKQRASELATIITRQSAESSSSLLSMAEIEDRLKSPKRSHIHLKHLESTLSPKLTEPIRNVPGPVSRYGRIQKQKECQDYIPLDVARFVTKSPTKAKNPKKEPIETGSDNSPIETVVNESETMNPPTVLPSGLDFVNLQPVQIDCSLGLDSDVKLEDVDGLTEEPQLSPELLGMDQIKIVDLDSSLGSKSIGAETLLSIEEELQDVQKDEKIEETVVNNLEHLENIQQEPLQTTTVTEVNLGNASSEESAINDVATQEANGNVQERIECNNVTTTADDNPETPDLTQEIDIANGKFQLGQLCWASFHAKQVHWPCMICLDPETGDCTIETKSKGLKLNVVFFADNGRRSYISEYNLVPFQGLEEYKKLLDSEFHHLKNRFKVFSKRPTWVAAVAQAEAAFLDPIETRIENFQMQVEQEIRNKPARKRRTKSTSAGYHSNSFDDSSDSQRKRRSNTPESPAYEPLENFKNPSKRIKREPRDDEEQLMSTMSRYFQSMTEGSDLLETASGTSSECDELTDMSGFDREAYQSLLNLSRMYVFEGQAEADIDQKLQKYVQKICSLRMQQTTAGRTVPFPSSSRVSNRLRSQALRNSFLKFEMEHGLVTPVSKPDDTMSVAKENQSKAKKEPKTLQEMFVYKLEKNYLLKGVPKGPICAICLKTNEVTKCAKCSNHYHLECLSTNLEERKKLRASVEEKSFKCNDCTLNKSHACFVCHDQEPTFLEERKHRCAVASCGKYYHIPCLRLFPQHQLTSTPNSSTLFCSHHTCHTCVSDNPRANANTTKGQMIRCIKCPTSYHTDAKCIPAGSQLLSNVAMICPKHTLEQSSLNVNWCFLCCKGGSLICCETCPTAFHLECLKFTPPEGKYICEECESGRMPLYNEIVWAKYGSYRFWPALIVPPPMIPDQMLTVQHNEWDICIKFFKSHDHAWINRRRIYLYQEDDSDVTGKARRKSVGGGIKERYNSAIREAAIVFQILQENKAKEPLTLDESSFKPPMYIKIRSNKYVLPLKAPFQGREEMDDNICECSPSDPDPCGSSSNCINRALMIECNQKVCPCGDLCQNRAFQSKRYPALSVKRIMNKGWGLVSQEDIQMGQFVIEYVGEVINNDELAKRLQQKQDQKDENYYFLTVDGDLTIDAGPKGNLARFINHSCEPNCVTNVWSVGGAQLVGLFAIKDIKAGDEITFNYNFASTGVDKKICHCGATKCSGFIGSKYRPSEQKAAANSKATKEGKKKRRKSRATKAKKVRGEKKQEEPLMTEDSLLVLKTEPLDEASSTSVLPEEKPNLPEESSSVEEVITKQGLE
ncbi:nuclear receptor binding SET domain protein isoform X2 [Uranotaenia lowii]|nr:nuclear receptor binding SET domain protein isoform X2 [Uranotaenia lowii]